MGLLFIIIGLIINVVISDIIGNLGKEKKIGYKTAWLCSFLLSPILGILFVIASVPLSDDEKKEQKEQKEIIEQKPDIQIELYKKKMSKEDIIVICFAIFAVILLILNRHLI